MIDDPAASLTDNADDLLRYFRRRTNDHDAADLLSETMTTAWRRVDVLPTEPVAARMWLFTIAHHTLLNHSRGERRRGNLAGRLRALLGDIPGELTVPAADDGSDVRDAIERLPAVQADVVRLVHWEGFTLAQAADVLGIPASTARNHYQRAKLALRVALSEPQTCVRAVGGRTS